MDNADGQPEERREAVTGAHQTIGERQSGGPGEAIGGSGGVRLEAASGGRRAGRQGIVEWCLILCVCVLWFREA